MNKQGYWHAIEHDLPRFAVFSVGSKRWFWAAWAENSRNGKSIFEVNNPASYGYEKDKVSAIKAAQDVVGKNAIQIRPLFAHSIHESLVKSRRKANTQASDTAPVEYVYSWYYPDYQSERVIIKHRIAKKTKRRIYVLIREGEEKTFVLDREKLERGGEAYSRRKGFFYTQEAIKELNQNNGTPQCFKALGLTYPATTSEVKTAYRKLAKRTHPDAGGNESTFVELKESYEAAMRLAS